MAFDGITTKAVITELQNSLIGGKVNKVFNPTKNEILLSIYNILIKSIISIKFF